MFVEYDTLVLLMPEIILVAMAVWMFIGGTFAANRTWWSAFAVASYLVAGFVLYRHGSTLAESLTSGRIVASGPLALDFLGQLVRWLALVSGMLITLMASHGARQKVACELLGLIMLATVGVMLVATSTDLVLVFLGLELISIPTYVLLYIGRPGRQSAEATAKYFFLSILSSALLLYGFSFLYGLTGTTLMYGDGLVPGIRDRLAAPLAGSLAGLAPLALVLVFAGLGFKMTAVPFHFYAPDVYQGTTNANAALLSVLPKIAGLIALIRLSVVALDVFADFMWQLTLVIAVLTMTVGNVCALWQTNVRRMMAYSSIAHAGYMLIGLAVALGLIDALPGAEELRASYGGVAALVFYLVVYAFASLGMFAVLAHLSTTDREVGTLEELAGLSKAHPTSAALIAVFMFSLAGIPPLAGFWGKLVLFNSAVQISLASQEPMIRNWFLFLAIAGALNAAVAAAYYLRVIGTVYFRPSTTALVERGNVGGLGAAVICAMVVILVGILPRQMTISARLAERALHNVPRSAGVASEPSPAPAAIVAK